MQIAFEPASLTGDVNAYFNSCIDIIFALDIIINFRTTIKNSLTDDEVFDANTIAVTYIKNRFFIDLLATIPFDTLLEN